MLEEAKMSLLFPPYWLSPISKTDEMKQIGGWLIVFTVALVLSGLTASETNTQFTAIFAKIPTMRPWLLAVLLTCPSPAAGQAGLPAEVLVGTDLKPLVSFRFTKARPIEPGNYASESGGATLEITIRASLELIRVFQEPARSSIPAFTPA